MAELLINGNCDDRFAAVGAAFERNFAERDELGAAVCIYADGQPVVDLWGGHLDQERTRPWEADTIVCMASVTKGMTALCVHLLIESGELELDAAMADYWPEFAQAGKEAITVGHSLGHHDGLIFNDAAGPDAWLDWDLTVAAIAAQEPAWAPGTRGAYNSYNYGFNIGEPLRRVSGLTPGQFLRERITGPLGVDYRIGLPEDDLERVSDMYPNPKSTTLNAFKDPSTNLARAWHTLPKTDGEFLFNTHAFRTREFPSGNGHGNARAVARIYAALAGGGVLDGIEVWKPETVESMRDLQWDEICGMTDRPFRMGLGLFLNSPPLQPMGSNMSSMGHMGAGGAFAFADPEAGIAFSYSPNFMCEGAGVGDRCEALVEALYN